MSIKSFFPVRLNTKDEAAVAKFLIGYGAQQVTGSSGPRFVMPESLGLGVDSYNAFSALGGLILYYRRKEGLPIYRVHRTRLATELGARVITSENGKITVIATYKDSTKAVKIATKLNSGTLSTKACKDESITCELTIAFKEKHDTRYFLIRNFSDLLDVCWKLFLEMDEMEYFTYDDAYPCKPELAKDVLAAWPEGEIKTVALKQWERWDASRHERARLLEEKACYTAIKKSKMAGTFQNKWRALEIMAGRRDYEYEGFEIVHMEKY